MQFISPEEVLAGAPEATRHLHLPYRWRVEIRQNGRLHRLGVEPDHVFGLRFEDESENSRRAYFFLEVDRGTMPVMRKGLAQTSFLRKLLVFQETWRRGLHRAQLAIPNFRVLTVTTTRERVEHLVEACRSLFGGARLFLFTHEKNIGCGNILACGWVNGWGEVVRLIAGRS